MFKDIEKEDMRRLQNKKIQRSELKKDVPYLAIILVLCIYSLIQNYIILEKDSTIFYYDIADTYTISRELYNLLEIGEINKFADYYVNMYYKDYPPLIVFQPFPLYYLLGVSEDMASFSNSVHVIILLISVYYIGKNLRSRATGLVASLILFSVPSFLPLSRAYLPDYAVASVFSLSVALFLHSEFFSSLRYSIAFGAACGIGMLAKFTFFIYIMPLMLLAFINHIYLNKGVKDLFGKKGTNLLYAGLACLLVMGTWYFFHSSLIISIQIGETGFDDKLNFQGYTIPEKITTVFLQYGGLFFSQTFLGIYSLFFSLAFIYLLARIPILKEEEISIFFSPILIMLPLLLFSASARYFFPIVIIFSVMAGVYITDFIDFAKEKKHWFRPSIISLLILFAFSYAYSREILLSSPYENNLYNEGIVAPRKDFVTVSRMISDINKLTTGMNYIVMLHDSVVSSAVGYNLNIPEYNPISEITRSHMCDLSPTCNIIKLMSREFICGADILLVSNITMPRIAYTAIENAFPEKINKYEIIKEIFNNCSSDYKKAFEYPEVIIGYGETAEFEILLKN